MPALNFNPADYAPYGDRQALPKGQYRVAISASEIKDIKDKPGCRMISFIADVIESSVQVSPGSKLHFNINHQGENAVANKIGLERLSALCYVTIGRAQLQATEQMHGKPFRVALGVSSDGKYNEIEAYFADDGTPVSKLATPAAAGFQPQPGAMPQQAAQNPYANAGSAPPAFAPQGAAPQQFAPAPQPQAQFAPAAAPVGAAPWQPQQTAAAPVASAAPWQQPPAAAAPAQFAPAPQGAAPPWGAQQ